MIPTRAALRWPALALVACLPVGGCERRGGAPRDADAARGVPAAGGGVAAAGGDEGKKAPAGGGRKHALLVGVNEYGHRDLSALKYAENDVERLADVLRAQGFGEPRILSSGRAAKDKADLPTAENVRKALAEVLEGKGAKDLVLIALSGHGVQLEVSDPDGKGRPHVYPYFCPADADFLGVSYSTGKAKRLINLNDLFEDLGRCGAGARLVLVDACRNELDARGARRSVDVAKVTIPDGVGAMFSCAREQRAWESRKLQHGVFFHSVIEGLKGQAKNARGEVNWLRLSEYVTERVIDDVPSLIGGGATQTPHVMGSLVGRPPVLARYEAAKEAPKAEAVKEPAAKKPEEETNALDMKFVVVPAGSYKRGSAAEDSDADDNEKPQHDVRLTRPFWLGKYEVSQSEYRAVTAGNPGDKADARAPVTGVTWLEAVAFCNQLSRRYRHKPYYDVDGEKVTVEGGNGYRLPTEAEWEYACRAGTKTAWSFGNDVGRAHQFGRFQGKGDSPAASGTHRSNPWGLFDMHGNVREWCWDHYDLYGKAKAMENPAAAGEGQRVLRGGSFKESAVEARSAARFRASARHKADDIGFRVARTPGD